MKVTSTRVRLLKGKGISAIASVTIDNELIINDIRVYKKHGRLDIRLPNSDNAKRYGQYSIIPDEQLYKSIEKAIDEKIKALEKDVRAEHCVINRTMLY